MFVPIHKHMIVKAEIYKPLTDAGYAKKFLASLVKRIGMVPVTEPQAVYVAESGNEGFTGSINLATSHIAFHIWDNAKLMMLDVYSCKEFNPGDVLQHIDGMIGLEKYEYMIIDRNTFEITKKSIDIG